MFTAETAASKTTQTVFTHKPDKSPQDGIWLLAPERLRRLSFWFFVFISIQNLLLQMSRERSALTTEWKKVGAG